MTREKREIYHFYGSDNPNPYHTGEQSLNCIVHMLLHITFSSDFKSLGGEGVMFSVSEILISSILQERGAESFILTYSCNQLLNLLDFEFDPNMVKVTARSKGFYCHFDHMQYTVKFRNIETTFLQDP